METSYYLMKGRTRDKAPVTVRSIAKAAGVSVGAVSSVLNNRHEERRISQKTVARVKAVASRLGYLPNIGARRLRIGGERRQTVVLALITSHQAPLLLVNHFVAGLREAAAKAGARANVSYLLQIGMFEAGKLSELPGLLTGDHFNAAVITNTTTKDDDFLARTPLPYPAVLVNRSISGYPGVSERPGSGTRAAEVFQQIGRRRLAVLHGSPLTQITRTRVNEFLEASERLTGRRAIEIVAKALSEEAAADAVDGFLARGDDFDALYAVTDGEALGAYHALVRNGRSIPRDVAVIGVGDYAISRFFNPPLSCVGASHRELALSAADILIRRLWAPEFGESLVELNFHERLRESTGHSAGSS
ncbi:MAG: LacI family DNA-binding transcriptional regulator [Opitutaceae bacterium]|nr:LacI family DNA-binding transcriptional regulator [Opitutaceae bacterium]